MERIHSLSVHRGLCTASTRGAQKAFRIHGRMSSEVRVVISSIGIPERRSFVGRAHQIYPIGAPSLRYRMAKRSF